jgi:hypothetical protein
LGGLPLGQFTLALQAVVLLEAILMKNQIEVRVEVSAKSILDVYFWLNGQRSKTIFFNGPEDELSYPGNPISESLCAWAGFVIQKKRIGETEMVWEVDYKSNVADNDSLVVLEGVKRKIEIAIKKGVQARIDLENDLKVLGWDAVI